MNETQPPFDTPLHNRLHKGIGRSCLNCKHVWHLDKTFYCGISGKFLLEKFADRQSCGKHETEGE